MEPDCERIFIELIWKSLEEKETYVEDLINIAKKDGLLKVENSEIYYQGLCSTAIAFIERYPVKTLLWVKAINNIMIFLNKNDIEWRSNMIAFIHGDGNGASDNCTNGYFILHKDRLIISTIDKEGVSTPEIYPLGEIEKLS